MAFYPDEKPIIERIKRDDDLINSMIEKKNKFIKEVLNSLK